MKTAQQTRPISIKTALQFDDGIYDTLINHTVTHYAQIHVTPYKKWLATSLPPETKPLIEEDISDFYHEIANHPDKYFAKCIELITFDRVAELFREITDNPNTKTILLARHCPHRFKAADGQIIKFYYGENNEQRIKRQFYAVRNAYMWHNATTLDCINYLRRFYK